MVPLQPVKVSSKAVDEVHKTLKASFSIRRQGWKEGMIKTGPITNVIDEWNFWRVHHLNSGEVYGAEAFTVNKGILVLLPL
jgi:hypothetical protein